MFNRALSWFTNYSAATGSETPSLDDSNDVENPLVSTAAPMADEDNLENPIVQPATNDDAVPESPTSSSPRNSVGNPIVNILKSPTCERLMIISVFLILVGIAVYHFVVEVNRISDDDFQLDSVVVSSFNVSKRVRTWDTQLSLTLTEGDFEDLDVRYEAPRIWLYSRDGFVSMTTPSIDYSLDGERMVLHAVFDGMRREMKGQVVSLGMVMETNAMRRIHVHESELEIRALVMIDCNDLKIEFDAFSKTYGTLVDGAKSCKVQVCPLEEHPLYDGADKCTTSSSRFKSISRISS